MSLDRALDIVKERVKNFDKYKTRYMSADYQEQEARRDFIDIFFDALGWDVLHKEQTNPYKQEVKVEKSIKKGHSQRRADYAFYIAPNYQDVKFYIEAKKPYVDIESKDSYFQIIRYGWNSQTPIGVLTDFEQFHIVDCRYRPNIGTALDQGLKKFYYTDYLNKEKFAEIYYLFSREAVAKGSIEDYVASLKPRKGLVVQKGFFRTGIQKIDESFLVDLDSYRETLARIFKKTDHSLDGPSLTEMTQRTLDRLVFLRFLEDKLIETNYQIANLGDSGAPWRDFIAACRKLDNIYNGIIFKEHPLLDSQAFKVDDNDFANICKELSHTYTPYDFNVIPIHILGSIYERFLGKVITSTAKRTKVEEKPEVRKAGGVYYTPEYIVRYIVENTIGKLIEGQTPSKIAKMRFIDISCGSGSFLLGMYQYLLDYHRQWYNDNPKKAKKSDCYGHEDGTLHLKLEKKREILLNNIHGVDIDSQAVEVAQLSLYLKMLEEETTESAHQYLLAFEHERQRKQLLPSLENNIKCGNSLIGHDYFDGALIFDKEEARKINAFDWDAEFAEIMKNGGFDAVIGNPPYLNIDDTWGCKDPKINALKKNFPDIYNDKTDILFYFLGKAVSLCKGTINFILSRAFLEAYKADKLRNFLLDKTSIKEIIDFRNHYVFKDAGITTSIITLKVNAKPNIVNAYKLLLSDLLSENLSELLKDSKCFEKISLPQSRLNSEPWIFVSDVKRKINKKIDSCGMPLRNVLYIGQGMQTGRNNVFGKRVYSEIEKWHLKPNQYFKRASNSDIQRYFIKDRGEYLLYLEEVSNYEKLPKGVQQHLKSHNSELKARAAYKRGDCVWWHYTWPLHKQYYEKPKILCPYLADRNRFALDLNKEYLGLTDTTVLFDNNQKEDLRYMLGLLNSLLLTFRFRSIGKLKSGNILEYFWNSISKIPIRCIDFKNKSEKADHDKMVKLVDQMLDLNKKLPKTKTAHDKNVIQRRIDATDKQIDALVYKLYGLTEKEIRIVEESVA